VIYNGFRNKYSFVKDEKFITLVPLSPKQVYEDQLKLKRKGEAEGSENVLSFKERKKFDLAEREKNSGLVESGEKKAKKRNEIVQRKN
jgi:hypothetical protein